MTIKSTSEIAHEVAAKYQPRVDRIRNDASRTPEWKRAQIAKVQVQVEAERAQALAERDAEVRSRKARLEYKLFGPATHHDDPSQIISRRDAGDRARLIATEEEAISVLRNAERVHDETLARAVVERCFDMGWGHGINTFLEPRQKLVPAAQELWDAVQPSPTEEFAEFSAAFTSFEEVRDLDGHRLERLAREVDAANAAGQESA